MTKNQYYQYYQYDRRNIFFSFLNRVWLTVIVVSTRLNCGSAFLHVVHQLTIIPACFAPSEEEGETAPPLSLCGLINRSSRCATFHLLWVIKAVQQANVGINNIH